MAKPHTKRFLTAAVIFGAIVVYGMFRPMGRIVAPTRWELDSAASVRFLGENRLVDAERCFQSALERVQANGNRGIELGTSFQNLGDLRCAQRRYEEAEQYYSNALPALDTDPRTTQDQIGVLLSSYAFALTSQAKHAEAEPLILRAISIREHARVRDASALAMNHLQLTAVRAALQRSPSSTESGKRQSSTKQSQSQGKRSDASLNVSRVAELYRR